MPCFNLIDIVGTQSNARAFHLIFRIEIGLNMLGHAPYLLMINFSFPAEAAIQ
ncbi:hypothetical protein D3C73_1669380 [compost metagenome]